MEQALPHIFDLPLLGGNVQLLLGVLALCSARIYVAFMVMPAMPEQVVHGPMRNGVCLMIGTFVAWGQPVDLVGGLTLLSFAAMLLKEALLGALLGFAFGVVFWVAQGVGALVDTAAGYNNVQMTNPLSGEQCTPVSDLLSQLVVCGFYMLGGMMVCVGLLFQSFHWWPLATLTPDLASGLEGFVTLQVRSYFDMTVKVAAPILLILVLVDLAFGLVAKTADKLEPQSLSQPVKGAVATLMLAMLVAVFFDQARPNITLRNLEAELTGWLQGKPPVPREPVAPR